MVMLTGMVEKPSVSAFQNFFQIENGLNIKKVMGRNVWMCFVSTASTYSIECIACFDLCINSVDKHSIFNALHALIFISTVSTNKIPYSIHNSIALIFCINCLDMPFNVHSNYNVDSNMKTSNYMKI